MNKIQVGTLLAVVGCVGLTLGVAQNAQSQKKVDALIQSQGHGMPPSYDPQKFAARNQHARELYRLWQARNQRDIAKDVIPFLADEDVGVRRSAVRVLARLETSEAQNALTQQLEMQRNSKTEPNAVPPSAVLPNAVSPLTLQLAVGRANSHDLKGKERIEALVKNTDLSFGDIVRLSQKVNSSKLSEVAGTPGYEILQETVSVLTDMSQSGEDVEPLVKQLTLTPAQSIQLEAASLPASEGAKLIVDYLASSDTVKSENAALARVLLTEFGNAGVEALVQKMVKTQEGKEKYEKGGYVHTFRAAALTGDPHVLPLLKEFENDPDAKIRYYAIQARKAMEQQIWYPPLP